MSRPIVIPGLIRYPLDLLAFISVYSCMFTSCSDKQVNQTARTSSDKVQVIIKTADKPTHRVLFSKTPRGEIVVASATVELVVACDLTNELNFIQRQQALQYAYENMDPSSIPAAGVIEKMEELILTKKKLQGMTVSESRALKNDILNLLIKYQKLKPEYSSQLHSLLEKVYEDRKQDKVMREYVLQFLGSMDLTNPDNSASYFSSHWKALEADNVANNPDLATTAMVLLSSEELSVKKRNELVNAAHMLAQNTKGSAPHRAAALQVCAQYGHSDTEKLALELADASHVSFFLRIEAVNVLGKVGHSDESKELLTRLVNGPNKRLRLPAQQALKRIQSSQSKLSSRVAPSRETNFRISSFPPLTTKIISVPWRLFADKKNSLRHTATPQSVIPLLDRGIQAKSIRVHLSRLYGDSCSLAVNSANNQNLSFINHCDLSAIAIKIS